MDLQRHLESYRKAIAKDALGECTWYSKCIQTRDPARYPTVYDYLAKTAAALDQAANSGDEQLYRGAMGHHQVGLIRLFEAMVSDLLWDYRHVTRDQVLDMIDELGPKWFKFCARRVEFPSALAKKIVWVPRYDGPHLAAVAKEDCREVVIFDADELSFLATRKDLAQKAAETKLKVGEVCKIVDYVHTGELLVVKSPNQVNTLLHVHDWTAPLFGEA
jgi:hypothetical protein